MPFQYPEARHWGDIKQQIGQHIYDLPNHHSVLYLPSISMIFSVALLYASR
jgi:hypothetical protein